MSVSLRKESISESLLLEDSDHGGVVVAGIGDNSVAKRSGLKQGDEIVAATIHLDHLNKQDVLKILQVLEPYDDNIKVLTKQGLKANISSGSLAGGLKGPSEMLTASYNLKNAEPPVVSLDGLKGQLKADSGLAGGINFPKLNGGLPNITMNTPSANLDGTLTGSDMTVSSPKLSSNDASIQMKQPNVKTGLFNFQPQQLEMPTFDLPHLSTKTADIKAPNVSGNMPTADINLSAPKVGIKGSDLDLRGENVALNAPKIEAGLNTPDVDLSKSGKVNWPHLKWKKTKYDGPNMEADMKTPNLDVKAPKFKGDINGPDVDLNLPKANLESPDIDVNTPNIEVDSVSGKINWPHKKWKKPKVNLKGPNADADLRTPDLDLKAPTFEGKIHGPDVDMDLPKADLESPNIDVNTPNIDFDSPSAKINWPHKKWKKPKVSGPNADMNIDANMKPPAVDLKAPKFGGDINGPDVDLNLPKADFEGPGIYVKAPNIDVNSPSGQINWPNKKLTTPKLNVPNADMDIDEDLNTPDLALSAPSVNLPAANIKAPDVDIKAPSVKSKLPSAKKPKWTISGNKKIPKGDLNAAIATPVLSMPNTNLDGEIHAPDVDLNLPNAELKGPESGINVPDLHVDQPSGKFKFPTLKKPKFGTLKSPKVSVDTDGNLKAPDLDLQGPDVEMTKPKLEYHIDTPDLDIDAPKANISAPDVALKVPDGKVKGKMPKLNLSKIKGPKLKAPGVDTSVDLPEADLQSPNLALSTPTLKVGAPTLKVGAPNLDANLPNADLKFPELDIHRPDVEAPSGTFKLPKVHLPKFGLAEPKLKGHNLDTEIDGVLPKAGLTLPNFKGPNIEGGIPAVALNLPKVEPDVDLKASGLNLSAPKMKADLSTPDLNINLPKADVQGHNVDLQIPDVDLNTTGKQKMPTLKLPKFGLSKPKVEGPDLNINTDLKGPKMDISVPDVDVKLPNPDIHGPDMALNAPNLKLSRPNMNGSDLDFNLPKGGLHGGLNLPKAQIQGQNIDLQTPDVNLDSSKKTTLPNFKMPTLSWSKPKVDGPDLDVNADLKAADLAPNVNLDTSGKLKGKEVQLNPPAVDMDAPLGEFKMPHYKLPKFGLSSTKGKGDGLDVTTPGGSVETDILIPKVNANVSAANLKSNKTSVNVPGDDDSKDPTRNKMRWPFHLKSKSGENSSSDSEVNVSDEEMAVPVFKLHRLPKNSIDGSGESDALIEAQKIPRGLKTEEKDYVISKGIRLPVLTTNSGGKVNIADRLKKAMEKRATLPSAVKPNADMGHPVFASSDKNDKLSVSLSNMLGLDIDHPDTE